ncbi:hypothetical protein TPHA_0K00290 [Tetrapisispora phaffii CBS 4417]|uniref:DNA repair and recombination protein RAD52 n=1 Tax=Tetrapisispora phaffii (strain ATCC 24235 / CBS 4417 / NBRC 1672 / NRRL Y-8282 / UCD 70-5) TaxID=1071381 RepID=G8BZ35_TETPH|nr:hypothetical protein TPHA_0K00290 [Tetrapisispora phaffii CBS 4417]CCE65163.1 hypothetical protein TPHA_0K00290 [Tetrapisispora phaffii CBS 4417]
MDEKKPFISMNEDIQSKLDKKLGPEYISKRIGFGATRVAYIEGWKAINLANQIFGYNGWSTEVKSVVIDFLDERQGKFSVGCTAIVRVTLANGTYREDIGYGTVENERRKAPAFERAKKSAVTDALKRSLRGFGNALGNCLYDKAFLAKIDKVKFDPPDFDEGNLFRPSDEISEISRSTTMVQDSNMVENNNSRNSNHYEQNKRRQLTKIGNESVKREESTSNLNESADKHLKATGQPYHEANAEHLNYENQNNIASNDPDSLSKDDELLDDSFMFSDEFQEEDFINGEKQSTASNGSAISNEIRKAPGVSKKSSISPGVDEPATFVTAKAATAVQDQSTITEDNVFDPKFQAQSIRHTLDQTTSAAIPVSLLKEKGMPNMRESVYEKFAPKGKQLQEVANTNMNANASANTNTVEQPETPVTTPASLNTTNISKTPSSIAPTITSPASHASVTVTPTARVNNAPAQISPNIQPGANRFAPPSTIVHPNTFNPKTIPPTAPPTARREVGRPKIIQYPRK